MENYVGELAASFRERDGFSRMRLSFLFHRAASKYKSDSIILPRAKM